MDCVILAAGKGTRMNSSKPKVLHELGGKPLIKHLLKSLDPLELSHVIVVVGHKEELVRNALSDREVVFASQKEQKGTAHALERARGKIESDEFLVVLGDLPLVRTSSLNSFIKFWSETKANLSFLTVKRENPTGYGRVKRGKNGDVEEIIEDQDATEEERKIKEINTGIYLMANQKELWQELHSIDSANAQGQFYLTDLIKRFASRKNGVAAFQVERQKEFLGINTRKDLAFAEKELNRRKMNSLFDSGVTVIDPESTIIETDVKIGKDTVIEPFTTIKGNTTIGPESRIGPNVEIVDGRIGAEVKISHAVVKGATVQDNRKVEPFSFLGSN
ncbi:MAG: NTP transferase domain-containing protein [Candidatus Bipolaricaulia bacterium]